MRGTGSTTGISTGYSSSPHLAELNIGHSIVARAMRVGFTAAVAEMKDLMTAYPEA